MTKADQQKTKKQLIAERNRALRAADQLVDEVAEEKGATANLRQNLGEQVHQARLERKRAEDLTAELLGRLKSVVASRDKLLDAVEDHEQLEHEHAESNRQVLAARGRLDELHRQISLERQTDGTIVDAERRLAFPGHFEPDLKGRPEQEAANFFVQAGTRTGRYEGDEGNR